MRNLTAATLSDALTASFRESLRTPEGTAEPVVLLWPDPDRQWTSLARTLSERVAALYRLGPYSPGDRTGPAIWLRCVIERSLPDASPPPGVVPIIHLPGVGRQDLGSAGECPKLVQPLVELQYRGRVWHQKNGRDWTIEAFLAGEDGVGLDISLDQRTRDALARALPSLLDTPLGGLRGRRLDAEDFDKLTITDPIRDVLRWMSDPAAFRSGLGEAGWPTFRSLTSSQLGLDPEVEPPSAAARALVAADPKWDKVWARFCEAPGLYRGVRSLLGETSGRPQRSLLHANPRLPQENARQERELREELAGVANLPAGEAIEKVLALEADHGARRAEVWAQLGESPLALALAPLSRLASLSRSAIGGATADAVADAYAQDAWRCDRAAIDSLATCSSASDIALVGSVVRAVYLPWLDASARHLQSLIGPSDARPAAVPARDTCVLFVDGLRYDLGMMLREELESRGLRSRISRRIAPTPTVTATAKPVAMPGLRLAVGPGSAPDFSPGLGGSGQPATTVRLREEMSKQGISIVDDDSPRGSTGPDIGWAEVGHVDDLGHKLGAGLVGQLRSQIQDIADRVVSLLDHGWSAVQVVTDHGWLLLPGGLPKVDLPAHLTESKWSRCATVKAGATTTVPTYPWHWDGSVAIAIPQGVACFRLGEEYAHGGISVQESVVPELIVERVNVGARTTIGKARWRGMRCRVECRDWAEGLRVDLRIKWADPSSGLLKEPKPLAGAEVALVVDDDHEGKAGVIVLMDASGQILDRVNTIIGEA